MRALVLIAAAGLLAACAKEESAPEAAGPAPETVAEAPADEPAASGETPLPIPMGETGGMCGGIAAIECLNAADYCAYAESECVRVADAAGTCTLKPEACTMDYNPVCGCDGKTYGNECSAAAEGVSVASRGECEGEAPATE